MWWWVYILHLLGGALDISSIEWNQAWSCSAHLKVPYLHSKNLQFGYVLILLISKSFTLTKKWRNLEVTPNRSVSWRDFRYTQLQIAPFQAPASWSLFVMPSIICCWKNSSCAESIKKLELSMPRRSNMEQPWFSFFFRARVFWVKEDNGTYRTYRLSVVGQICLKKSIWSFSS